MKSVQRETLKNVYQALKNKKQYRKLTGCIKSKNKTSGLNEIAMEMM